MACNGLKMGSLHLFVHTKWSRTIFGLIAPRVFFSFHATTSGSPRIPAYTPASAASRLSASV